MLRAMLCLLVCSLTFGADNKPPLKKPAVQVSLGLLPIEWPADNPYWSDKVELGCLLYFDKRLSQDDTISCASCHSPEHAYTDGAPNSTGIKGQHGGRSAPSVLNRDYSLAQFWDGRAPTLEEQAKGVPSRIPSRSV